MVLMPAVDILIGISVDWCSRIIAWACSKEAGISVTTLLEYEVHMSGVTHIGVWPPYLPISQSMTLHNGQGSLPTTDSFKTEQLIFQ